MVRATIHISATPEQVEIIDALAAKDARPGEKPNRSRTLVDLALAEHERRKGKAKR